MRWPQDATGWPLAQHSRIVLHRPHRWHIQQAGQGPTLLFIHGAGGATHSWRDLFPEFAKTHRVVAVDLPGQGFTQLGARQRCGLDPMAHDLLDLLRAQQALPDVIVAHSAGAAIALRMVQDLGPNPPVVIGINAALSNFKGVASWLFPMMAKLLSLSPFTADLFSTVFARPDGVKKLISGTGSTLDAEGLGYYHRLASDRAHVDATLAMMAQWKLDELLSQLDQISARTMLVVGEDDLAVAPDTSAIAASRLPNATLMRLPGLGHLAHEEDPKRITRHIRAFLTP